MNKTKRWALVPTALALTGLLAACTGGGGTSAVPEDVGVEGFVIDGELIADQETYDAAREQTLTIYTGFQESNQIALNEAFTEDTGIEVEFIRAVPNQLVERVLSEHGADQLPADIIITSDYDIAHTMGEAGIWEPHRALPVADQDDLFVDDADFTRLSLVVVTFAYNTQLVDGDDAPESWADLLDEKWAGKIGITQGTAGGSSVALNRFLTEEVDPDFWEKMAELSPTIFDSGGARQTALARGELSVATAGTAAVHLAVTNDNAPIQYVIPAEGLVAFNYFAGRTSVSKNAEAAEVFLNWAMSKRGQEVVAGTGNYAVRGDVAPPVAVDTPLPALDSGDVWVMPAEQELEFAEPDADVWREAFGR